MLQWLWGLAGSVDFVNMLVFTYIFLRPCQISLGKSEDSFGKMGKKAFLSMAKMNVFLTTISCISSVTISVLVAIGRMSEYAWLGGNIDMMVNALCVFCMLATNRAYAAQVTTPFPLPPLELPSPYYKINRSYHGLDVWETKIPPVSKSMKWPKCSLFG